MCWIGTKNSQILFWLASFVLMSLYKDVENIVKWCPGIKFKSRRDFGPLFKSVQGGATHWYKHKKTSHARKHSHARTHARTHEHTHTHTDNTISNHSVFLSPPPEKCSRYHPRTALVPFLSTQRPFPVPLGDTHTHTQMAFDRCSTGKKNSQILFSLPYFSLCRHIVVKGCPGIKFKSNRQFGPHFWSVQGGATNCIHIHKTSHARTHARTHTHTHERTHVHTHTNTHTLTHDYTISDRSLSPSLRHTRSFQGTIHVPPWYLFYPLRNPFLYLSDTHKQGAIKGVW